MYNIVDPSKEIPLLSFRDFVKLTSYKESEFVQLDLIELKNILSVISLKQLYLETINENWKGVNERKEALGTYVYLSFIDNTIENYTKEYIYKMMDDFGYLENQILKDLTGLVYQREDLFINKELDDFCNDYLIEELMMIRIADFGRFLSSKICDDIFRNIDSELDSKFKKVKIEISNLTKKVVQSIRHSKFQFEQSTIKLLINAFHYAYNPNYSDLRALDFAKNYLLDPLMYSKEKERLLSVMKEVMQHIIKEDRNRYKNRWNR